MNELYPAAPAITGNLTAHEKLDLQLHARADQLETFLAQEADPELQWYESDDPAGSEQAVRAYEDFLDNYFVYENPREWGMDNGSVVRDNGEERELIKEVIPTHQGVTVIKEFEYEPLNSHPAYVKFTVVREAPTSQEASHDTA